MRAKLYAFPTTPKGQRLAERARILGENFQDPNHGVKLMIYLSEKMYDSFNTGDIDWLEMQILAKLHELTSYLELYEATENEDHP